MTKDTAPTSHPRAIHLRGGVVIDPVHHDRPVQRDVYILDGVIVPALPADVSPHVIDAANCHIMAGGVDMHTHIASTGVNLGRQLQGDMQHQGHRLVPSTFQTGRLYAAMGYTTAIEAAVAPSDALHAHFQLDDTPCIDTGILTLVDNHQLVIDLIAQDDRASLTAVVNELLTRSGALGMKAVNPGGVTAWRNNAAHHQIRNIHQSPPGSAPAPGNTPGSTPGSTPGNIPGNIPGSIPAPGSTAGNTLANPVTPARILKALAQVSDDLNLPHPLHLHGNRLGQPGNVQTLIDTLDLIADHRAHIAHLQFYAYGQTAQGSYTSAAGQLVDHLARHPQFTADVGMVMFGPAMTITADTPLEHDLWRRTGSVGRPAVFSENELEAALGVMPASYERRNRIHSLQWAIGLELLLRIENPWQLCLSIDHPNGGSFLRFPEIIALLTSKDLRQEALAKAHPYATRHTTLGEIDRELTLHEIAILTRAAPARMLGLSGKGHLGPGATADLTLYRTDLSDMQATFARPRLVLKAGQVIAQDGQCLCEVTGSRLRAALDSTPAGASLLDRWRRHHGSTAIDWASLPASRRAAMTAIRRTTPVEDHP